MGRGGDPVRQLDEEEEVSEEDRLREASDDDDGVVGRVVGGEGEASEEVLVGCSLQGAMNLALIFVVVVV
jgi:hypothetical protein